MSNAGDGRARLGDGEPVVVAAWVIPAARDGGQVFLWAWAYPLLLLWRRVDRRRRQQEEHGVLAFALSPLGLLSVTQSRLLFWGSRRASPFRRPRVVGDLVGTVDRGEVLSLVNDTIGRGWRTCRLSLTDGRQFSFRVRAAGVAPLLAALSAGGTTNPEPVDPAVPVPD